MSAHWRWRLTIIAIMVTSQEDPQAASGTMRPPGFALLGLQESRRKSVSWGPSTRDMLDALELVLGGGGERHRIVFMKALIPRGHRVATVRRRDHQHLAASRATVADAADNG